MKENQFKKEKFTRHSEAMPKILRSLAFALNDGIAEESKTACTAMTKAFTRLVKHFRSNPLTALLRSRMSRFSQTKFRNFVAHSYGFTLAEVLITLTVLGVIAAITIPGIVRNFQDRATVTKVKRAYSILDNAMQMAIAVNGPIASWSITKNTEGFMSVLKNYLPIQKYCGNVTYYSTNIGDSAGSCIGPAWYKWDGVNCTKGNMYSSNMKLLNGSCGGYAEWSDGQNVSGKALLKNGMSIKHDFGSFENQFSLRANGLYGVFTVDINGPKYPNQYGIDVFKFPYGKDGLMPPAKHSYSYWNLNSSDCKSINDSGYGGCSYWILKHNNMDYKYRDVSSEW